MTGLADLIRGSLTANALLKLADVSANKVQSIFCRGVYLAENTSQAVSVEFVRRRRTNYADKVQ